MSAFKTRLLVFVAHEHSYDDYRITTSVGRLF